jgi:hypothetical protein
MLIFLDTEFTDFTNTELISIGLATDGHTFYAELNDFSLDGCSDFVKKVVLPQLGKNNDCIMNTAQLRQRLLQWLAQFKESDPVICYDFDGDWLLFTHVMDNQIPEWLSHRNVYRDIDDLVVEQFFVDTGLSDHHALHDASANRFGYRPKG